MNAAEEYLFSFKKSSSLQDAKRREGLRTWGKVLRREDSQTGLST